MEFYRVGLFGGTFDPIHNGHLAVALGILEVLPVHHIELVPCGIPPHGKQPVASIQDRVRMIELAIQDYPQLQLNKMEADRHEVSYTIDTLKQYHFLHPSYTICLILATDVMAHLNEWHHWQEILDYCHIIIANRPQFFLPKMIWMDELLKKHSVSDAHELFKKQQGCILSLKATPSIITATNVRHHLVKNEFEAVSALLPASVLDYIQKQGLYQSFSGPD